MSQPDQKKQLVVKKMVVAINKRNVQWTEVRKGELFFISVDIIGGDLMFEERDAWEVRWYPFVPTRRHIQTLQSAFVEAA